MGLSRAAENCGSAMTQNTADGRALGCCPASSRGAVAGSGAAEPVRTTERRLIYFERSRPQNLLRHREKFFFRAGDCLACGCRWFCASTWASSSRNRLRRAPTVESRNTHTTYFSHERMISVSFPSSAMQARLRCGDNPISGSRLSI
ncbi:hypothetical protein VFPPC_16414 [Pochonia chlamydosporia 170]|uniref:Uncharacterized protein n=1 Tax=Pochonia chlamydosporia 170 TaxID=1380566 RepID=A0A179FBS5_METCM|nr:hypothetical protein VFPPC_16414 [Pochonia chlamydosporia 170]OAQ63015.1 hypothetical protein VFPPC_16414 [Pochonia chlamydosporia 170]